jgi:hypothetical protein
MLWAEWATALLSEVPYRQVVYTIGSGCGSRNFLRDAEGIEG